jgi:hypothetical protein
MTCCNLGTWLDHHIRLLNPLEFMLATYLYRVAANEPGRTISCPIESIAEAIGLSEFTVQWNLKQLKAKRVIDLMSREKESLRIRIPEMKTPDAATGG